MKSLLTGLWKGTDSVQMTSLPRDVAEARFAVLDTETTGLNPVTDRILCLGALKLLNGRIRVQDTLEIFVEQEHFDHRSVPIHGIRKMGSHERIPEKQALETLQQYMEGCILVGHHIGFDLAILRAAFSRHGMPFPKNPFLDTALLYRKTLLKSPLVPKKEVYTLDDLARKYEISCKDRHTALGDAYITAIAFLRILAQLRDRKELSVKQLIRMGN